MTDKVQKIREEVEKRYEYWKEKEFNSHSIESEIRMSECKHLLLMLDSFPEEPVVEDLEEAAQQWYDSTKFKSDLSGTPIDAFKAGAKWQKEQFEKNRLKHCNSITNEQAELEQGFIDQHLDKHQRIPTFLDAIEYGMNIQKEQMMKKITKEL